MSFIILLIASLSGCAGREEEGWKDEGIGRQLMASIVCLFLSLFLYLQYYQLINHGCCLTAPEVHGCLEGFSTRTFDSLSDVSVP